MPDAEPEWEQVITACADGVLTYRLRAWSLFSDFLEREVFDRHQGDRREFIWRGQRRDVWPLSTSLDRLLDSMGLLDRSERQLERWAREHLERFKYAARGRRGAAAPALEEVEWWALGQHYGLATPLLDWSHSPYAAAYFAFDAVGADPTPTRVVWALDRRAVVRFNTVMDRGESFEVGRMPVLAFIEPLSDENPRLVSQGGLFTRGPIGTPVEAWVRDAFAGSSEPILLRIEIPDSDRIACLRTLARMNISHLTLFPDLGGASHHVNRLFELAPLLPPAA